ncbi:type I-E CRISPR-associated endoribonuclease Cas2 [Streptococcus chenjunshii]|uniref:DNA polymerase III polC-type n=1 Tax=Streptococcus chenjunshii TaxID=2173853 RepID=A0A372KPT7_9STRE|nr:type I-E CRISPR-associated endoribonuclease Cas2e [Streptococcus chenjunshii]AXQ78449.1 type I-E CRISPR-associated endoribonuclease Cas2 [Streptococcus chenjunshii]RFU52090.1 type I-E CRISPR-associated endoribonuclease Cas2 [Streptococcus chenjunshii]RFU54282.1 type I-E CRISPR-associated endoribonuclease Cas2 [Streptococcus chenjunshii]
MPLTVITVTNVPPSLKGDLTKWMQEIATGVYVGNFNTKVREQLWERVQDNVGNGEATISYAYRNEIGYQFDTVNAQKKVADYDGIPLVMLPSSLDTASREPKLGFSDAARFRKIRKYTTPVKNRNTPPSPYVVVDIETDGLNEHENTIIEIGAIKVNQNQIEEFEYLVHYDKALPKSISRLTGISQELLNREGMALSTVLQEFLNFIENLDLIGYGINFDIKFINRELAQLNYPLLKNKTHDLMRTVKNEKLFLPNYKLQTVLKAYGIEEKVPHRALPDSKLIYKLSTKVNKFWKKFNHE